MTDQALTIPQHNIHVFARDPREMAKAQRDLIAWVGTKIEQVFVQLAEANENLNIAKAQKWRTSGWRGQISKHKGNIKFYQKVREALKAGYYIIPDFPVEVFAIRTKQTHGKGRRYGREGHWTLWEDYPQDAQKLELGEGEYKAKNAPAYHWQSWMKKTDKGEEPYQMTMADEMQPPDFPFKLVKPQTMDATARAMALKVFDEIGALPQPRRRGDPIVVGRILRPYSYGPSLTFFIAWWLNTEEI